MKKLFTLMLALGFSFSIVACDWQKEPETTDAEAETTEEETVKESTDVGINVKVGEEEEEGASADSSVGINIEVNGSEESSN